MTVFGVTGHQVLPPSAAGLARKRIEELFAATTDVVGVSSLAAGADQLFADVVLALGGRLEVVIPASGYEETFSSWAEKAKYETLLAAAGVIDRLPFARPDEEAFWAAGRWVVDRCEVLVAVWDGASARGLGGTADVVGYAKKQGRQVEVIWPSGVERDDA
jgi:hypothetical protein